MWKMNAGKRKKRKMAIKLEDVVEHSDKNETYMAPPPNKCFYCHKEFRPQEHICVFDQGKTDSVGSFNYESMQSWTCIDGKIYFKRVCFHEKCFMLMAGKDWMFE